MKYPVNASASRPRQQQRATQVLYPAPNKGINAISNLSQMEFGDAIFSYNIVPSQYGSKVRDGYIEHCTNVGDGGVRTIIPYVGSSSVEHRLFACAEDGIYDVSTSTDTPTQDIAFAAADDTSGFGVWVTTTNSASAKFICYTDETNGYYVYTEASGTWAKIAMGSGAGEISGVDPATFCFVMIWKERLWFIQKNTGTAWYLATGALFGVATKFEFGNKFKYGGDLRALYNWTVDGGIGVDDYLVALSGAGDVVVYQGTDPDTASAFSQRGVYYIGAPPAGRRIAGALGGDLFLLSTYGLIPISRLLSGQTIIETNIFVSQRITPLINAQMSISRNELGWEVRFVPAQTLLLISTPKQSNQAYLQFVQSTDTYGWAVYRDFPYTTGDTWEGSFYVGDAENRVLLHSGGRDDVPIDDAAGGDEIEFSLLTAFHDLQSSGANKIAQFIRATFIGEAVPSYQAIARYDYNVVEALLTPPAVVPIGSVWDVGLWDAAIWGAEFLVSNSLGGAYGMGRSMAIAVRGSCGVTTTLVKFDVTFTVGNVL